MKINEVAAKFGYIKEECGDTFIHSGGAMIMVGQADWIHVNYFNRIVSRGTSAVGLQKHLVRFHKTVGVPGAFEKRLARDMAARGSQKNLASTIKSALKAAKKRS